MGTAAKPAAESRASASARWVQLVLGIVGMVPIANVINTRGYETAFIYFGLAQGLVVVLCALLLRAPQTGDVPDVTTPKVQQSVGDFTPLEMLKAPVFWLLYAMMTMLAMGGLMATAQLGPIAADYKVAQVPVSLLGITMAALPFALSLDRILNGLTRPFFGWASDHIGRENTMLIAFGLEGVGILLLITFAHIPSLFVVFSGLVFFAWGEIYSLFPAVCGDLFGRKFATANYGLLYTAKGTRRCSSRWGTSSGPPRGAGCPSSSRRSRSTGSAHSWRFSS